MPSKGTPPYTAVVLAYCVYRTQVRPAVEGSFSPPSVLALVLRAILQLLARLPYSWKSFMHQLPRQPDVIMQNVPLSHVDSQSVVTDRKGGRVGSKGAWQRTMTGETKGSTGSRGEGAALTRHQSRRLRRLQHSSLPPDALKRPNHRSAPYGSGISGFLEQLHSQLCAALPTVSTSTTEKVCMNPFATSKAHFPNILLLRVPVRTTPFQTIPRGYDHLDTTSLSSLCQSTQALMTEPLQLNLSSHACMGAGDSSR